MERVTEMEAERCINNQYPEDTKVLIWKSDKSNELLQSVKSPG